MSLGWFQSVPIFLIFIATTIFIIIFFEVGYQVCRYYQSRYAEKTDTIQGSMAGAMLGMLAFVLAFTFSMAAARFDLRKHNLLDEVTAIKKAYLASDLVAQPYRAKIKGFLREYVDIRLLAATDVTKVTMALTRSGELHQLLWTQATLAAESNPTRPNLLVFRSITGIIEIHERRLNAAIRDQTPGSIWITVYAIAGFAMLTLGFQTGVTKTRRIIYILPTVLAFSALITLIAELDRPALKGMVIGQGAMIDLQKSMNKPKQ